MKSSVFLLSVFLGSALAWSQGTSQSPPPPPKSTAPASPAIQTPGNQTSGTQAPATQLKPRGPEAVAQTDPNRIVATIGGKQITAKEALDLLKPIGAEDRKRYEAKLSQLVQQVYMEDELAAEATKLNLDQQSPWKEQLQLARANILTQAYLSRMSTTSPSGAPADDPKQYYDTHPTEFEQLKLDGIFVAFSAPGTPATANPAITRTEQEARTKVDDLEKKIKGGGDFAALARSDSDNQASAARDGELGVFSLADPNLPPDVKAVMQKLQPGEVSEPVRLPNGFYILKLVSRTKIPFDQARASIVQKLQNDKNQALLKQELDKYKIEVQDPDFFNAAAAPAKIPSLQKPSATQPSATQPAATPVKPPPHS